MSSFRFESPAMLLLLLPVFGVSIYVMRRRNASVLYSSVAILKTLPATFRQRLRRFLPWLQLLGLTLLTLALARPQSGREETRIRTEGIAIQMCIDRSGSMQALDFPVDGEQVDRLTAVKSVLHRFVAGDGEFEGRTDDLIGLIAFGGFASALCPPTLDHGALLDVLKSVKIPEPLTDSRGRILNEQLFREENATAIGDALALAVDRLTGIDAKSKIVVMLTDGDNTAGVVSPLDAATAAAEFGIKVYTIGVGSNGVAPYAATDMFGNRVLQQQRVSLDEETLKAIAKETGGQYLNAKSTDGLRQVYSVIDQLEKTQVEGQIYTSYRELFVMPMWAGLGCILLTTFLGTTWLRALP